MSENKPKVSYAWNSVSDSKATWMTFINDFKMELRRKNLVRWSTDEWNLDPYGPLGARPAQPAVGIARRDAAMSMWYKENEAWMKAYSENNKMFSALIGELRSYFVNDCLAAMELDMIEASAAVIISEKYAHMMARLVELFRPSEAENIAELKTKLVNLSDVGKNFMTFLNEFYGLQSLLTNMGHTPTEAECNVVFKKITNTHFDPILINAITKQAEVPFSYERVIREIIALVTARPALDAYPKQKVAAANYQEKDLLIQRKKAKIARDNFLGRGEEKRARAKEDKEDKGVKDVKKSPVQASPQTICNKCGRKGHFGRDCIAKVLDLVC